MKSLNIILIALLLVTRHGFAQNFVKINPIVVDSSFDETSYSKLMNAVRILDSVFNSKGFENEMLRTTFNVGNYGLSNMEIYKLILSGANNYDDINADKSIDLRVKVFDEYHGFGNFGITNMSLIPRVTRTHRCYILRNDVRCYVSHLAHEYMHQIGFYDEKTWFGGKKTKSVPYKIGNIVDKIIGNTTHCTAIDETCKK